MALSKTDLCQQLRFFRIPLLTSAAICVPRDGFFSSLPSLLKYTTVNLCHNFLPTDKRFRAPLPVVYGDLTLPLIFEPKVKDGKQLSMSVVVIRVGDVLGGGGILCARFQILRLGCA